MKLFSKNTACIKSNKFNTIQTLSLIIPVYITRDTFFLKIILEHYNSFPLSLKKKFQIILIDDCSPIPVEIKKMSLNVSVYRIIDDIKWNIPGARNLGVMAADTENILLIDMDHFLPLNTVKKMVNIHLKETEVWKFKRFKDGKEHYVHPGTFFMKKKLFLKLNGCDEDFSGHYGSDGHFNACIKDYGCTVKNSDLRIDTYSETDGSEQHNLVRDFSYNERIMMEKNKNPLKNHSKKILRFKWEFVKEYSIE